LSVGILGSCWWGFRTKVFGTSRFGKPQCMIKARNMFRLKLQLAQYDSNQVKPSFVQRGQHRYVSLGHCPSDWKPPSGISDINVASFPRKGVGHRRYMARFDAPC
jgi:hypothetical protein